MERKSAEEALKTSKISKNRVSKEELENFPSNTVIGRMDLVAFYQNLILKETRHLDLDQLQVCLGQADRCDGEDQ